MLLQKIRLHMRLSRLTMILIGYSLLSFSGCGKKDIPKEKNIPSGTKTVNTASNNSPKFGITASVPLSTTNVNTSNNNIKLGKPASVPLSTTNVNTSNNNLTLGNNTVSVPVPTTDNTVVNNMSSKKASDKSTTRARVGDHPLSDEKFDAIIVLLHGINSMEDEGLKKLCTRLKIDVQTTKKVGLLTINIPNSGQWPTEKQADLVYNTLVKKGLQEVPAFLIGDSHGGVVMGKFSEKYQDKIAIVGIIVNHSPFEGAPGLAIVNTKDQEGKFKALMQCIQNTMLRVNPSDKTSPLGLGFMQPSMLMGGWMHEDLIEELATDSQVLKAARAGLLRKNIKVLMLGGKISNFNDPALIQLIQSFAGSIILLGRLLHPLVPELVKDQNFIKALAEVFGKDHDFLVPLDSQMASNTITSPHVQRKHYDGYHHFFGITSHPGVYNDVLTFIQEGLEATK
eukprot:gene170-226_t